MSGNFETRVKSSIARSTGPLIGSTLLSVFKSEIIKENVFKVMFGNDGERIFDNEYPNINETIMPALLLSWKSETFRSFNVYFEGQISALIALPTKLEGDSNALRQVGLLFQRFMGGGMSLFDKVPALTMFGYGSEYNYDGLAKFDGFSAPAIQITIPFKFDLQRLQVDAPEFDVFAPLDDSDVGWVEQYIVGSVNEQNNTEFSSAGISTITGAVNV